MSNEMHLFGRFKTSDRYSFCIIGEKHGSLGPRLHVSAKRIMPLNRKNVRCLILRRHLYMIDFPNLCSRWLPDLLAKDVPLRVGLDPMQMLTNDSQVTSAPIASKICCLSFSFVAVVHGGDKVALV